MNNRKKLLIYYYEIAYLVNKLTSISNFLKAIGGGDKGMILIFNHRIFLAAVFISFFSSGSYCGVISGDVLHSQQNIEYKQVTVIGSGYVGLVTGAGLAELGHTVICADINKEKIEQLQQGNVPFFEPGLQEIITRNINCKRLLFTFNIASAIQDSNIIIIAVGTPMGTHGKADLSALKAVVKVIGENVNGYKVICTKSTVPIGTNKLVQSLLEECTSDQVKFDVVSNPEFLREGSALEDFMKKNPIVIGSNSKQALSIIKDLYRPLCEKGILLITTDFTTAETIKYAWNAFSATRIAYINELAQLCNAVGANIFTVITGMSFSDQLLPTHAIKPGPGIGGSCLPKDTRALIAIGESVGVDLSIVKAVVQADLKQRQKITEYLYNLLDNAVQGKTVAVLGLSFKANTDDVRYSPAIFIMNKLLRDGAYVKAYDPQAMKNMENIIPDVQYCKTLEQAIKGTDAILILTDWDEFKNINLAWVSNLVNKRIVVDARNIWNPKTLMDLGFQFTNLGRKSG